MELRITLFFNHLHRANILTNGEVYEIRRRLARLFERCAFGIISEEDDRFWNQFAMPIRDSLTPDSLDLIIDFEWPFPIPNEEGNVSMLITEGFPGFMEELRDDFEIETQCTICYRTQ